MPPILDLSVAVVAVRTFGISRGVLHYCERLVSHDAALGAAASARVQTYRRLAGRPGDAAARLPGGELAGRVCADVDQLAEVLVRALLPITVAAVLSVAAVLLIGVVSLGVAAVLAVCLLVAGVLAPWLSALGRPPRSPPPAPSTTAATSRRRSRCSTPPSCGAAGRLPAVIAETRRRQRDWGAALDRAAAPAAIGAAVPTLAIGAAVLAAAVAGIGLADRWPHRPWSS